MSSGITATVTAPAPMPVDSTQQLQAKRRKLTEKRRAQNREAQRLFRERKRKKLFDNIAQSNEPNYWDNDERTAGASVEIPIPAVSSNATNFDPSIPAISATEQDINEMANRIYNEDMEYLKERNATRGGGRPELISLSWLLNNPSEPNVNSSAGYAYSDSNARNGTNNHSPDQLETADGPSASRNLPGESRQLPILITEESPSEASSSRYSGTRLEPTSPRVPLLIQSAEDGEDDPEELVSSSTQVYTIRDVIKAGLEALSANNHGQEINVRLSGKHTTIRDTGHQGNPIEAATERFLEDLLTRAPSPFRTLVDCRAITTLRAFITNANAIGFWDPHPQDFKDPYKSPFVQSYFLHNRSVQTVKQQYSHVYRHLQPLDIQCNTPHRAYIDVFPFPEFRERILTGTARGWWRLGLDENELCDDLGRGALVCWSSGKGKYGGEPWDPRSWEIRPWFLRKWGFLCTDEMRENSRWWRHIRDEYTDDLDRFDPEKSGADRGDRELYCDPTNFAYTDINSNLVPAELRTLETRPELSKNVFCS
ncbi:hypothetical protein TWF694_003235 [Orbilia ellipsospora]|uniref:BZIP domain-containing protein n=1 Tax=Orbilia ellipsospora TaxID=2528407 RepID=A0AAV9X711_9PEZI